MRWITDLPTEYGRYWMKLPYHRDDDACEIVIFSPEFNHGGLQVPMVLKGNIKIPAKDIPEGTKWAGPLVPPKEG